MDIILIAAITADGYIARHSNEVVDWSQDLHLFRKQTGVSPSTKTHRMYIDHLVQKALDSE